MLYISWTKFPFDLFSSVQAGVVAVVSVAALALYMLCTIAIQMQPRLFCLSQHGPSVAVASSGTYSQNLPASLWDHKQQLPQSQQLIFDDCFLWLGCVALNIYYVI